MSGKKLKNIKSHDYQVFNQCVKVAVDNVVFNESIDDEFDVQVLDDLGSASI